jgi:U3 small nucleolar RNA-associated protein 18
VIKLTEPGVLLVQHERALIQVAGLVGRSERSLESFAACPAADNPLVAFMGNEGCVPLVSLRSRQCVGDLKMSGTVRTAAFSSDGLHLLTSGQAPPCPFLLRCTCNVI